jgi:hypothetical protein
LAFTKFATRAIGPAVSFPEELRLAEHLVLERDAVAPRALGLLARERRGTSSSHSCPSSFVYGHLM